MARPTKFTIDILQQVHQWHFTDGISYPEIVELLKRHHRITTTKQSLKVKMANFNQESNRARLAEKYAVSVEIDTMRLQGEVEYLIHTVKHLQAQMQKLTAPKATGMQILEVMNGQWYGYKELSQMIYGDDGQAANIRKYINHHLKHLVEIKYSEGKAVLRKVE